MYAHFADGPGSGAGRGHPDTSALLPRGAARRSSAGGVSRRARTLDAAQTPSKSPPLSQGAGFWRLEVASPADRNVTAPGGGEIVPHLSCSGRGGCPDRRTKLRLVAVCRRGPIRITRRTRHFGKPPVAQGAIALLHVVRITLARAPKARLDALLREPLRSIFALCLSHCQRPSFFREPLGSPLVWPPPVPIEPTLAAGEPPGRVPPG